MLSSGLPRYLWCFVIPTVLELVNNTAITNRDLSLTQTLQDELDPTRSYKPNLSTYKVIGSPCEVYILTERRSKGQKLLPRSEPGRLLAVLGSNIYLVYIPTRHVVLKTSLLKIYENRKTIPEGVGIEAGDEKVLDNSDSEGDSGSETTIPEPLNENPLLEPIIEPSGEPIIHPIEPNGRPIEEGPATDPMEIDIPTNQNEPEGIEDHMDIANLVRLFCYRAKNKVFRTYNQTYGTTESIGVPQTWKQVLKSEDKDR